MSIVIGFLYVIEVIVCLLLALVVMLQKPKEGGLGGLAGSLGESVLGADAGSVLVKTTAVLGAIFLLNTLVLARLTSTVHSHSLMANEAAPEANLPIPTGDAQLPNEVVPPAAQPGAPVSAPATKAPVALPAKAPELPAPAPVAPAAK